MPIQSQRPFKAMACGNCGHGLFRVFSYEADFVMKLVTQCEKCDSTSVVEPVPATLRIEFGDGSDGRLCRMDPKTP